MNTLTIKGQITIPVELREQLNLVPGNKIEFFVQGNHLVGIPLNRAVKDLYGILPKPEKALTCEEMNDAIRERHNDRTRY